MKIPRSETEAIRETQMVSLADIAFLIIFFFLLSSTFMKDRTDIALPSAPKTSNTETPLTVAMDEGGKIFLENEPVESPDMLQNQLSTLLAGKTDPKECEIRFKCYKGLTYKEYKPVYEAISAAGGVIAIVHDLKPEQVN
jgi:biopolymer transport protein ExbD